MKNIVLIFSILLFGCTKPKEAESNNDWTKGIRKDILQIADSIIKVKYYPVMQIDVYNKNDSNFIDFIPSYEHAIFIEPYPSMKIIRGLNMGYIEIDSTQLYFYDMSKNGTFDKFVIRDSLTQYEDTINLNEKPKAYHLIADVYYIENDSLIYIGKQGQ